MISSYQFGSFQLDPVKRLLFRDGGVVPLTPKVFEILLFLVEHAGKIVEKDAIINRVWPDTMVEESNVSVNISILRKALGENLHEHQYILTHSGRGYSFVAEVNVERAPISTIAAEPANSLKTNGQASINNPHLPEKINAHELQTVDQPAIGAGRIIEPAGGALPLNSPFYIERPADKEFFSAIVRYDSLVLVKGARQVGKTSLLARGLQQAREWGARVVLTDLQNLNSVSLESIDKFFLMLAELIADQLGLLDQGFQPSNAWSANIGASANFERFWRRDVLNRIDAPIVWGLDEIDRIFSYSFASEVFGLFRSWHNKRALDPQGPWMQLTLAMAYATEAHLFITDLNQSPFNVGTRLQLEDFTPAQIYELNQRYGGPLEQESELQELFRFVGGHPYLINRSLWEMKAHGLSLAELKAQSERDDGVYSDHLRRLLVSLLRNPELCSVVRGLLQNQPIPDLDSFFRLRSAGVITGHSTSEAAFRCELYRIYLQNHLIKNSS